MIIIVVAITIPTTAPADMLIGGESGDYYTRHFRY